MNFVTLTHAKTGDTIYVNMEKVFSVSQYKDGETILMLDYANDVYLIVTETPNEVFGRC